MFKTIIKNAQKNEKNYFEIALNVYGTEYSFIYIGNYQPKETENRKILLAIKESIQDKKPMLFTSIAYAVNTIQPLIDIRKEIDAEFIYDIENISYRDIIGYKDEYSKAKLYFKLDLANYNYIKLASNTTDYYGGINMQHGRNYNYDIARRKFSPYEIENINIISVAKHINPMHESMHHIMSDTESYDIVSSVGSFLIHIPTSILIIDIADFKDCVIDIFRDSIINKYDDEINILSYKKEIELKSYDNIISFIKF